MFSAVLVGYPDAASSGVSKSGSAYSIQGLRIVLAVFDITLPSL
jgi:hypothetical protein